MTLEQAIAIAAQAHKGQTRWNGAPYILHPLRVMLSSWVVGRDAMIAAVLHDVVEDTDWTIDDLASGGLSGDALEAVELITKDKDTKYADYIDRIAKHPIARAVKLADLEDNMSIQDVPFEMLDRHKSMMDRYSKAKAKLLFA